MRARILAGVSLLVLAAGPAGAAAPPRIQVPHFNFVRLEVADVDKSIAFYTQVTGLHERGRLSAKEVFVGDDDALRSPTLNLTQRRDAAAPPTSGPVNLGFVVDDVNAALAKAAGAGGKSTKPLVHTEGPDVALDIAYADDPDGNHIELMHYSRIGPAK